MPILAEAITFSLAPGIALNGLIFYNTSLQNRFVYITGRARELNREARALWDAPDARSVERLASLRRQVGLLTRRSRIVRRSILLVYVALFGLILTILELLLTAAVHVPGLESAALVTFGAALVAMGLATLLSWSETYLSQSTILEDMRTSFPPEAERAPPG
jgi:hypothetical protein